MDLLTFSGVSGCLNSGLLTAAGAETVYDTTVIIEFAIDGVLYRKAAVTDGTTPTTDGNTGAAFTALTADQTCYFLWCLNSSGTVKVAQGEIVDGDPDVNVPLGGSYPSVPAVPAGCVPFAIQRVHADGTASAWTFGTSNWNATGIYDVILNLAGLPIRPPVNAVA